MARYRITIESTDRQAMLDLVNVYHVEVLDHGSGYSKNTGYRVDAIADNAMIAKLKHTGYAVHKHEDVDKVAAERQREVGRGDRYQKPNDA
ncbi:MAG: hypothetical protein WCC84_12015 [Candidatus Cybelea sp.]